jgi:HEAT repeats
MMMRIIQIATALIAIVCDIVAIGCFVAWLGKTDWLMGHTYGPSSFIFRALWTACAGILATGIWASITLFRRSRLPATSQRGRDLGTILQMVTLVLMLVPVLGVAAISFLERPRAQLEQQIERMESGNATVLELIEALNSPEHDVRWHAVQALTKLGPKASPAAPDLARALNDRSLNWDAANSLAAIGPGAAPAVPALVEAIQSEKGVPSAIGGEGPSTFSSLAGKALARIGPAALPALTALLSHDDRYVRMSAVNAIGNMGPQAKSAVPALSNALNDTDPIVGKFAGLALERIEGRRPVAD